MALLREHARMESQDDCKYPCASTNALARIPMGGCVGHNLRIRSFWLKSQKDDFVRGYTPKSGYTPILSVNKQVNDRHLFPDPKQIGV